MNSIWQQFALTRFIPEAWLKSSSLYQLVGLLQVWRQGSWLLQWADLMAVVLVSLVFGLGPFVSTTLIGMLLLACAAFWILPTISEAWQAHRWTLIHWLVGIYWVVASAATVFSPVKTAAIAGWGKLTLYLLLFALMARVLRSPRSRNWLMTLYLLIALIVSVYGLRQYFFGAVHLATWVDPTSSLADTTRVYSYLENPNLLAGYLIPAVAFSLAALLTWSRWGPKALALILVVANSVCLVLTYSRGGWIGFVVTLLVFGLLVVHWWRIRWSPFWRTWALPLVIVTLSVGIVLAVLTVDPLRDRVASIFAGRADSSNNFRLNVWAAVLEMIRDRPILGIGPGNEAFNQVYPLYMRPKYSALSAYSVLLEIAVETGLIGLVTFLGLLGVTLSQGWHRLQKLRHIGAREGYWLIAAIATLAGMFSHGLVDTVWYRPQVHTLWWLAIALIAGYCQRPAATNSDFHDNTPQTQR